MSYEKFFELIDKTPLSAVLDRKKRVFDETDPSHFYLENIRSFFGIPTWMARMICERGVEAGVFVKHYEYHCPNEACESAIASTLEPLDPEAEVECEVCELEGRSYIFRARDLRVMEFYSYVDSKEREVEHATST